ncbi:MAG: hypothetical protein KKF41_11390 [Actinobacteria bacterium]|nr:hypothetical protein [Actinomycetota bacterium]MBU1944058.1 hypothetical protein [Actinomycetota bacterium]MBU2688178.1 hypothetical protein [Actinomycetota bacterium]
MAIKIISDVHGEYGALADRLEPDDTAVLLGDYLNLIDFRTLEGILSEVFSSEEVAHALALLAGGDRENAKRQIREVVGNSPEKQARMGELIHGAYSDFFASIPCRCYMLYGNTDNPALMRHYAGDNVTIIESGTEELDGQVFGFISGTPHGPWTIGLPGEMEVEKFEAFVASLGPVDVLCTHYPPAVDDLTWDVEAGRDEAGSHALLGYVDTFKPSHHYFGHVHNPRATALRRGETCLVNVGYFRRGKTVVVHPVDCK